MRLNIVDINVFYLTFTNVLFIFLTFLCFLTFLKIFFERFLTSMTLSASLDCRRKYKGKKKPTMIRNYSVTSTTTATILCLFYCMVVKSGTCLLLICTKNVAWNNCFRTFLMRVGERVPSRFNITAIPCLHLYWLIRERYCFIKRLFVEAMLC